MLSCAVATCIAKRGERKTLHGPHFLLEITTVAIPVPTPGLQSSLARDRACGTSDNDAYSLIETEYSPAMIAANE